MRRWRSGTPVVPTVVPAVVPAALRAARAALAGRAPGLVRPADDRPTVDLRKGQESGVLVHPDRAWRRNRQQA